LGSLHGVRGGRHGGHGAVAQEEEAMQPPALVREGGKGRRRDPVGQLGLLGRFGTKWPMGQKK
jgi:hypothetical protein